MPQALYRRYRPETFDDVIGQAHVTEPLQQALRHDRIHHAYLFSGPRGCGKTTSARILARCLNCEKGPTPTPCGQCQSCQDLARGGSGSLDVIEIDAATHGLVDDARELRERAFYSPSSSRYKVYIIDEAHMLGPGASNALLKVVEEPPSHVKFVFATTEPDKVIPTIRSRVHHYPFRLVPPGELLAYLGRVCEQEGVTVDKGVLPLVVRAGRGSVRDSMSVLDQLVAGAGDDGVSYHLAVALLGYTDATLLDDTIDAMAAGDGAAVFTIVDRVVEAGHDPRRFAEDLLERLRDLVIIDAVPDAATSILGEHPPDEVERMRHQATHFGAAELSRAADIINTGLTEMRGATAPRLQLELMCARVLLPGAAPDGGGLAARMDRLERRISIAAPSATNEAPAADSPAGSGRAAKAPAVAHPGPASAPPDPSVPPGGATGEAGPPDTAEAAGSPPATDGSGEPGALDLTAVRRMWPDVLEAVKGMRRFTWTLLSHNAQVAAVEGGRLTLAMVNAGARESFARGGSDEVVREALVQVLGVDWKVEAIVDPSAGPSAPAPGGSAGPPAAAGRSRPRAAQPEAGGPQPSPAGPDQAAGPASAAADDVPSADDPDADDAGLSHQELLARELGARVIGEYDNG